MANQLSLVEREIDATEDLLKFKLDKARNRLIRLDVLFGVFAAYLTTLTVVGNLFGMNLPFGGYADGTVPPGGPFVPPTGGGTGYAGPWEGGPSWLFLVTVSASTVAAVVLLITTLSLLGCANLLKT
mmetsp:Transcript_66037/g.157696  ORF Transcript_66037/g.157696 Transcript_66037/m.157696 type:complete len:127 (+) Transcript_66037:15-395(+)